MTISLKEIYRMLGVPIIGNTPSYIEVDRDATWMALTGVEPTDHLDKRRGMRLVSHAYITIDHLWKVIMAVIGGGGSSSRKLQSYFWCIH
jgi:hypothetical protein